MRKAMVVLILMLGGCEAYRTPLDERLSNRIDAAYEARDACLARNAAAIDISHSDTSTMTHAVAMACRAETDRLIVVLNRDGDPKVSAAIVKDSEFRAAGFVLRARGMASN